MTVDPIFDENPFSDDEQSSVDDFCKTLQEKGTIHSTFAEFGVITELSRVGRKWCYESYATCQGKKIDELVLPSEHGSSRTLETEESPPIGFVKRASRKHLEQCEKVQAIIKEEKCKRGDQKKRKIIKSLGALLLLALIAGGSYCFIRSRKPKEERSSDPTAGKRSILSADAPQLILEYSTIRGKVESDQQGISTIILTKTDVVTVNVIDPNTGETVAQGVIHVKLADTLTDDTGKTAQDTIVSTLSASEPKDTQISTPVSSSPTLTSTPIQTSFEQQLKKADAYFTRRQYTTPKHDNAFEIYQDILREDPSHAHAKEKIGQMAAIYKKWGDNAYQQKKYSKAESYYQRYVLVARYMFHTLGDETVKQEIEEVEKRIGQIPMPSPF